MNKIREYWKVLTGGWLGFITYAVLGALIAVVLQSASGLALDTDYPIVTVSSPSMVPVLGVGDIAIVKGDDDYEVGEIVIFDGWRERPIIHRIVMSYDGSSVEKYMGFSEISDDQIMDMYEGEKIFITKGDNNSLCDQCSINPLTGERIPPVTQEDVYGKKVATVPKIGLVKTCLTTLVSSVSGSRTDFKAGCFGIS